MSHRRGSAAGRPVGGDNLNDPALAAYQFAGLVMYQPMNQVMFAGADAPPAAEHLTRIADSAVDVFLAAYGPRLA